ncbi:MAG: hypothetical protein ABIW33_03230, partial [Sphingomicrobium sp.]
HYWMLFGFELLLLILVVVMMYSAAAAGYVVANLIGGAVSPYSLAALILALIVGLAQAAFTVIATVMLTRIYADLAAANAAPVPISGT